MNLVLIVSPIQLSYQKFVLAPSPMIFLVKELNMGMVLNILLAVIDLLYLFFVNYDPYLDVKIVEYIFFGFFLILHS